MFRICASKCIFDDLNDECENKKITDGTHMDHIAKIVPHNLLLQNVSHEGLELFSNTFM